MLDTLGMPSLALACLRNLAAASTKWTFLSFISSQKLGVESPIGHNWDSLNSGTYENGI